MNIKLFVSYFIFFLLFLHWVCFGRDSNSYSCLPVINTLNVGRAVSDHIPLSFLDMPWVTAGTPLLPSPPLPPPGTVAGVMVKLNIAT